MFTIYGGKTEFSQWEQGQRVTNPKLAVGDKVRFWNQSGETHPMIAYMHEGVVVADVPNDLLQHCSPILVELCGDPECLTRFIVNAQDKPAGYKFIDNTFCEPAAPSSGGVLSWNDLTDKPFGVMEAIEGNFVYNNSTYSYRMDGEVPFTPPYVVGDTVKITFDGTEYEFTAEQGTYSNNTCIYFGHWGLINYRMGSGSDVVLWCYNINTGVNEIYSKTGGMHTISLPGVELATPLDEKFLPTEVVKRSELPEFEVVFTRTGTMDFDTNMESFTSDNLTVNKTYDEIKAALDAGRRVVGILEEDRATTGNEKIRIKLDVSMSTRYNDLYFMGVGMMFYGTHRYPCLIEFKVEVGDAPSGYIYYLARPDTMTN